MASLCGVSVHGLQPWECNVRSGHHTETTPLLFSARHRSFKLRLVAPSGLVTLDDGVLSCGHYAKSASISSKLLEHNNTELSRFCSLFSQHYFTPPYDAV